MFLHLPLVIALAVAWFFLHRSGSLKFSHALACGAFGFYLSDTSLATSIQSVSTNLFGMIGQISF
ncbi:MULTISPECIES: hypothetical protein [unclassified Streptomyces]|uniref:hypothetical protein n=1 Tax=unclassified Streptomyces TaxID=2593676 RepID=UPI002E289C51|nr:hypothetical protein [Streptomyces sp. NBC_00223]